MAGNSMIFGQSIRTPYATPTAANAVLSGTTLPPNAVALFTAGANGSQIRRCKAKPLYTSGSTAFTATQAQLIGYDPVAKVYFLIDDATIGAQTLAPTGATAAGDFGYTDAVVKYVGPGIVVYAAIGVAWTAGVTFHADVVDL